MTHMAHLRQGLLDWVALKWEIEKILMFCE